MKLRPFSWFKFVMAGFLMLLGANGLNAADVAQQPEHQQLRMNFPDPLPGSPMHYVDVDGQAGLFVGIISLVRTVNSPRPYISITSPSVAPDRSWTLRFELPETAVPAPGVYQVHKNAPGTMNVFIEGTQIKATGQILGGTVKVLSASLGNTGQLGSFHALFTVYTDESERPIIGEIRYETPPPTAPAPHFSAGIDREFTTFEAPVLRGGIIAHGNSQTPQSVQWSKVDGPGDVVFTDAAAITTPVSFSEHGTYTLRLQVSDGENVRSDEVQIAWLGRETFIASKGVNRAEFFAPPEYKISASVFGHNQLKVSYREAHDEYERNLIFGLPGNAPFAPGVYRTDSSGSDVGRMSLPDGSNLIGEFQLVSLELDQAGAVLSAWVKYRIDHSSTNPELVGQFGEVRIYADVPGPTANGAPTVYVGPDLVTNDLEIGLVPVVADDLLPYGDKLQYSWQVLSGPVGVVVGDATSRFTTARFPGAGVYRLSLTVTDGEHSATDEMQVVIKLLKRRFEGLISYKGLPMGNVTFNLTAKDSFTARLKVGPNVLNLKGNLATGGWSKEWRIGRNVYEIIFVRDRNDDLISGRLVLNGEILDIVTRQTYGSMQRAIGVNNPYAGRHTLVLIPPNGANVTGAGYGDIVVKPSGAYRMNGVLGDGVRFSVGGNLTIDEVFDIYLFLRGGNELVFGTAGFSTEPAEGLRGGLVWIRKPGKNQPMFPEGIHLNLALHGSLYKKPASGESLFAPAANLAMGMDLFDRTLPYVFEVALNFTSGPVQVGRVPTGFTMRFDPKTGFFRGTLPVSLGTTVKRRFGGAILQGKRVGAGHFLVDKHSGGVFIEAVTPQ